MRGPNLWGNMRNILITEPEYFNKDAVRVLSSMGKVTAKRFTKERLGRAIRDFDVLIVRVETHL